MDIAAYGRVSTNHDDQLDSLENQREFFVEYARRNGHRLVHLYADEGISGTSLRRREQFQRLMQDARLGLFQCVVAKDVSRFARNTVDFLQSIRELKAMGVNVMFITANMESLGESEFILTIFGAMAQEESANLSKRVKFGKRINAKKGRVPRHVYGYDRIDNFTLAINPLEAQVVRDIFQMYTEDGLGFHRIRMALNRRGTKTKFGTEWDNTAIKRILTNSIYCGDYVNHKYESESYLTGRLVKVPEEQQFHHDRPEWAIITPEKFEQAQKQLEARRTKYRNFSPSGRGRYSSQYPFSTLIKCEHCGKSYCRKTYTHVNTRVYWKCATNDSHGKGQCDNFVKLEEKDLLREIKDYLIALIGDKGRFVSEVLSGMEYDTDQSAEEEELSKIERRHKELLSKKEKYMEMYANDVITMQELKTKTSAISEELMALTYQIKARQSAVVIQQNREALVAQYTEEIHRFLELDTVTNVDMRKIIDHISVNKNGNVRIFLRKIDES